MLITELKRTTMDDLGFDDLEFVQKELDDLKLYHVGTYPEITDNDMVIINAKRKRGRPKKEKERKMVDKHRNVTTELLLDTEQYRIGEIFKLLKSDNKDTTRQQAVRYLLSYSDLLSKDIAREVIAIANSMLQDETVRSTVKIKIASDLKAFLGTAGKKKFVRSTFEELRKEDGILEVEVQD